ncbi:hypothetical protein GCM10018790_59280 [Kitasatospora xanthocidica]|uniref:hypothetical protein n=1 Tax=Kitasatospora xanthocidica TaxID=83382 RepID=UPI001674A590|nr:hypothetical protein [Kitasatospora xanthocidica]GHF73606.1 hypothetical protein GCM10018790_59280 [Kitasatospora xanthocidica]
MAWYQGRSRITVTAVEGQWPQRAVVTVRGGARMELPGEVGAVRVVEGESWQLDLEHRHQGEWCPNIRAVQGRWQEIGGVSTQVVHSRNRDQAGDRQDRNLVLRIERLAPAGTDVPAVTAAARRTTVARHSPGAPAGQAAPRTSAGPANGPANGPAVPGVRTSGSGGAEQYGARPTTSTGSSWNG